MRRIWWLALILGGPAVWADELVAGPYSLTYTGSVVVKPAQLADSWGLSLGLAWESVVNGTVTAGLETSFEIPVVSYPERPSKTIDMATAGLRLGFLAFSDSVIHLGFNHTLGLGLVSDQRFFLDETSVFFEITVLRGIHVLAGAGYRYTYGINPEDGLSDSLARGLILVAGLRYGELVKTEF